MGIYDRDYFQDDVIRPLRPWDRKSMVTLLIIANVAVFLADFLFTGRSHQLMNALALQPQDLQNPLLWIRMLSYGFAHANLFHILFNMLVLFFLGQSVEHKYGRAEFLRIYLTTIVLCGLVWSLLRLQMGETGSLVGASGGATAIAMLFVFSFPQATLYIWGILPVKAWVVGIVIVLGNIFGSREQVAYDVHLIGVAFAAAYFFGGFNLAFMADVPSTLRNKLRQKRRGLKIHRPASGSSRESGADPPDDPDQAEADRILAKIHRDGKDSLSSKEQRFLEQYSRRVRQRRGGS